MFQAKNLERSYEKQVKIAVKEQKTALARANPINNEGNGREVKNGFILHVRAAAALLYPLVRYICALPKYQKNITFEKNMQVKSGASGGSRNHKAF